MESSVRVHSYKIYRTVKLIEIENRTTVLRGYGVSGEWEIIV